MKKIGELLQTARFKKKYTIEDLEEETKIKTEFIRAIEEHRWEALPEFPVVSGFVKNIASYLDVDRDQAMAFLRRDYPLKVTDPNPKPDVTDRFTWSPKLTFFIGLAVVVILISAYLIFQFIRFSAPPELTIDQPAVEQRITESEVVIKGKVSKSSTIVINNQPVLVEENGDFETTLPVFEGTEEIEVVATARSGKEAVVIIPIRVELEN